VITRFCIIRNYQIISDGKVVFSDSSKNVDEFLLNAYAFLKIAYPKFYKMDTLSKLGFLAAEVLLQSPEWRGDQKDEDIALVLSNAHASLDADRKYFEAAKLVASPALFVYTLSNIVAGEICIRHKIKGENAFFVSGQFDAALTADYVGLIPAFKSCVAGWVDVLGEHHDVFLYLCEKNKPAAMPHTAGQIKQLYTTDYGTINGKPEKADH
jgi:hypothetical protein